MTAPRRPRLIPAVARIDQAPHPTKQAKFKARRQVDAWRKQAERNRR